MILIFFCQSLDLTDGISGSTTHWLKSLQDIHGLSYVFTLKPPLASDLIADCKIIHLKGNPAIKAMAILHTLLGICRQHSQIRINCFQYQGGPYLLLVKIFFFWSKQVKYFQWKAHSKYDAISLIQQSCVNNLTFTSTPLTSSARLKIGKLAIVGQECDKNKFYNMNLERQGIIVLGRINKLKNYPNVLLFFDAFLEQYRPKYDDLKIFFYGRFETNYIEEDFFKIKSSLASSENILYKGIASHNDLCGILNRHLVCIHDCPGALDRSIVEASMSGTPVISTNPNVMFIPRYAVHTLNYYVTSLNQDQAFAILAHALENPPIYISSISTVKPPIQQVVRSLMQY